jgi:two-component system chemotaxis response regulator CheB
VWVAKVKVLIVDDSVVYRTKIRSVLQELDSVDILGVASNGRLALERMSQNMPDLLILDLEMPEMDGIQTLEEINKRKFKCKVLVFSSLSQHGAEHTMTALSLGASDFITKPGGEISTESMINPSEKIKSLLIPKMIALFPQLAPESTEGSKITKAPGKFPPIIWDLFIPKIIVIGSSTGGPTVLEEMFLALANTTISCPIVIAQHMPPVFTASFAERLTKASGIPTKEASHGEVLEKNRVYIVPGDYHLRLTGSVEKTSVSLDQGPAINSVRPAVDPLFTSAASIYKNKCLGIILTGMGADGKAGCVDVKLAGGAILIQDKASCVVFGMPGAVYEAGAYDKMVSPKQIVDIFKEKVAIAL